jgi:hypothetical protein
MTPASILRLIQANDPDGGESRPTDTDYLNFEVRTVNRFGRKAWEDYRRGGWDNGREV